MPYTVNLGLMAFVVLTSCQPVKVVREPRVEARNSRVDEAVELVVELPQASTNEDTSESTAADDPYPRCPVGWQEEGSYPLIEYEQTRVIATAPEEWSGRTVLIEFRRRMMPAMCVGWRDDGGVHCDVSYVPTLHEGTFALEGVDYSHRLELVFAEGDPKQSDVLSECVVLERTDSDGVVWEYVRILARLSVKEHKKNVTVTTAYVM